MRVLAVDIGNSLIKWSVIENGAVGELHRAETRDLNEAVADIVSVKLPVVLCSVRSQMTHMIKTELKRANGELCFEIDSSVQSPVSGFYEGIGADRIAAVSAAWAEFDGKRPVAVVSLGTATTITTASRAGSFKGGFITLGLGAICATLGEKLPELPPIDPKQARSLEPAFDTYSSICRGTVSAHVGIIEEWVSLFRRQIGEDIAVIATGGWSELIAPFCFCLERVDPLLTMKGIWTVYQQAQKSKPR